MFVRVTLRSSTLGEKGLPAKIKVTRVDQGRWIVTSFLLLLPEGPATQNGIFSHECWHLLLTWTFVKRHFWGKFNRILLKVHDMYNFNRQMFLNDSASDIFVAILFVKSWHWHWWLWPVESFVWTNNCPLTALMGFVYVREFVNVYLGICISICISVCFAEESKSHCWLWAFVCE